jgi:MarR family transcriptional regulator, lower aerobic nicotinate degradation pathway regulator
MSMDDLYAKPGHLIRRAQQIAVAMFMEECTRFEVTTVQYAALVAIRETPDVDATRLSALVAFDRSTLGDVLERLEAKGLIERAASSQDKRVKILRLSREGARTLREVEPAVMRAQERILAPLKPDDRRRFMALLAQLVEVNNEASRAPLRLVSGH